MDVNPRPGGKATLGSLREKNGESFPERMKENKARERRIEMEAVVDAYNCDDRIKGVGSLFIFILTETPPNSTMKIIIYSYKILIFLN